MHADKPAVVIELKWEKSAQGAIAQIKDRHYTDALKEYRGNLLLAGINYNRETKTHTCVIEQLTKKTDRRNQNEQRIRRNENQKKHP